MSTATAPEGASPTPNRLSFAAWRWPFRCWAWPLLAVILLDLVILSAVPPLKRSVS